MDRSVGSSWGGIVSGPRPGRMRDRRGSGRRGPMAMPGPLSPRSVPAHRSSRESFDLLVGDVLGALDHHFTAESDHVDIIVEEAPLLPAEWTDDVPLSIVPRTSNTARTTRIVLFRLPMTHRCNSRAELEELVWAVVLERLAEVWHMSPEDLDPR